MLIRPYQPEDQAALIELWRACGLVKPQNDPVADIRRKCAVSPELFLVGTLDSRIIASAMAGYDGHRGWIYYLAVAPDYWRGGYGRQIIDHAEQLLRERGCPKINLQVRVANQKAIGFYKRIGFVEDEVLSFGKRLIVDRHSY